MSKLIIEHDNSGRVFFYEEAESHHSKVEKYRSQGLTRRTLESLHNECAVNPGEYFVIDLVEIEE